MSDSETKTPTNESGDESDSGWVGPMPSEAAKPQPQKKRKGKL